MLKKNTWYEVGKETPNDGDIVALALHVPGSTRRGWLQAIFMNGAFVSYTMDIVTLVPLTEGTHFMVLSDPLEKETT